VSGRHFAPHQGQVGSCGAHSRPQRARPAWSLYGLKTTFEKQGMQAEAREAEKYLSRAWSGDRKRLDLQRL